MTEQRATYDAGQPEDRFTEAQLTMLLRAAQNTMSDVERIQLLATGVIQLVAEVRDLRQQVNQLADALAVAAGIQDT